MRRNFLINVVMILILSHLLSCKGRLYKVPSSSMAATFQTGQSIYVEEANNFQRNDIVVFNHYGNDYSSQPDENGQFRQRWEKRVSRIIAVSGDELLIKDGTVFLNKKEIALPPGAMMPYRIYTKEVIEEITNRDDYVDFKQSGDTIIYFVNLSQVEVDKFKQQKNIIKINRYNPDTNIADTFYARLSATDVWNSSNYGLLKIPSPGEKIWVNEINYKLYKNIPGIKKGENIIKETLYFVMGDNRYAAEDSRFVGFISQSNMHGIVR